MIGKFNDSDYEGLVLKIPAFFIELNGLQLAIDELYNKLNECNKSMYLPDHLNNLYELENMQTKKEMVKKRRDLENKVIQQRKEREAKILSGEMYELEWLKKTATIEEEDIRVNDEIICYNEYMTDRLHIKQSFIKKIMPLISTFDSLKQFALTNCYSLYNSMQYANENMIDLNIKFYCTNYAANMGISYQRLYVKTDYSQTGKYLRYMPQLLIQFPDGCLGIDKGGNMSSFIRLEGYEMKGLTLIKKEAI